MATQRELTETTLSSFLSIHFNIHRILYKKTLDNFFSFSLTNVSGSSLVLIYIRRDRILFTKFSIGYYGFIRLCPLKSSASI